MEGPKFGWRVHKASICGYEAKFSYKIDLFRCWMRSECQDQQFWCDKFSFDNFYLPRLSSSTRAIFMWQVFIWQFLFAEVILVYTSNFYVTSFHLTIFICRGYPRLHEQFLCDKFYLTIFICWGKPRLHEQLDWKLGSMDDIKKNANFMCCLVYTDNFLYVTIFNCHIKTNTPVFQEIVIQKLSILFIYTSK